MFDTAQVDSPTERPDGHVRIVDAADDVAARLLALQAQLAGGEPPAQAFAPLVDSVARLIGADACCLVLRDRGAHLAVIGLAGAAPAAANFAARRMLARSSARIRDLLAGGGVAGDVPLQETLGRSQAMYLPVLIGQALAGVLYVRRDAAGCAPFAESAVARARLVACMIGQALHVERLGGLLQSKYTRASLLDGAAAVSAPPPPALLADPCEMSRRLARGFYRELRRARFGERQIVGAATEMLDQLRLELRSRGSRRQGKRVSCPPTLEAAC